MTSHAEIQEAAHSMAEFLKGTSEWTAWAAAQAALERDQEVAALQARLDTLSEQWQVAQRSGEPPPERDEIAGLQRRLREHSVVVRQRESSERLVELLRLTNDMLSARLGVDFAENAARGTGATCCE